MTEGAEGVANTEAAEQTNEEMGAPLPAPQQAESQIYNWGVKKDPTLAGAGRGQNRISSGYAHQSGQSETVASTDNVPQPDSSVNPQQQNGETQSNQPALQPSALEARGPEQLAEVTEGAEGVANTEAAEQTNEEMGAPLPAPQQEEGPASIPKGAKLSKFWTNTLNRVERAANAPSEVSNPLYYMPKTEAQSLAEAASALAEDQQGTVEQLLNAKAWDDVQNDASKMVYDELYKRYVRDKSTANLNALNAWRKVMQEHNTATARGLQSNAKYL